MMFYELLERIMQERDLTVASLARETDLPDSTIRSILARKSKTVALDVAAKISKNLNIPMSYFCDCAPCEKEETFSQEERDMIALYRRLDRWGKEAVDRTFAQQKRYCK